MEDNRFGVLLLILFILFLSGDGNRPPPPVGLIQDVIHKDTIHRDLLVNSTFNHPAANLTGVFHVPRVLQDKVGEMRKLDTTNLFDNISGIYNGHWKTSDVSFGPKDNETAHVFGTKVKGKVSFRLEEVASFGKRIVKGSFSIRDEFGGPADEVSMFGVHLPENGHALLASSSKQFLGVEGLPNFAVDNDTFTDAKEVVLHRLNQSIALHTRIASSLDFASMGEDMNTQRCEYVAYLQFHSVDVMSQEKLQLIERELRVPSGIPLSSPPPIVNSALLYSPNCGHVLEWTRQTGMKIEHHYQKLNQYALFSTALAVLQLWLLLYQMQESNTPSTVSKVSSLTISMHAIFDGYLCMAYLSASVYGAVTTLAFLSAAFLYFLLVSVFGMRYLIVIRRVQRPEERAAEREQQQEHQQDQHQQLNQPAGELPLPATAVAAISQQNIGDDDDGRYDLSMLYTRFYFLLMGMTLISIHALSWPESIRRAALRLVLTIITSFWVPQIYRNMKRCCRHALNWKYVAGLSITRVLTISYFLLCPVNVLSSEPDPTLAYIVTGWIWLQVCVLVSQEILGPRYLVPANILPPAYDYHRVLPIEDIETHSPDGAISSGRQGQKMFDCAICMTSVDVQSAVDPSTLSRRNYMVTPCMHVFHTACLESWIRVKLQCPVCRNTLPPL